MCDMSEQSHELGSAHHDMQNGVVRDPADDIDTGGKLVQENTHERLINVSHDDKISGYSLPEEFRGRPPSSVHNYDTNPHTNSVDRRHVNNVSVPRTSPGPPNTRTTRQKNSLHKPRKISFRLSRQVASDSGIDSSDTDQTDQFNVNSIRFIRAKPPSHMHLVPEVEHEVDNKWLDIEQKMMDKYAHVCNNLEDYGIGDETEDYDDEEEEQLWRMVQGEAPFTLDIV